MTLDELRVRQIVMNGLTNAAKYSDAPANGAIRVVVRVLPPDDAVVAVTTRSLARSAATVQPTAAAAAFASTLCFDVLDCGAGLRGIDEETLVTEFATTRRGSRYAAAHAAGGSQVAAAMHGGVVGSSGVGLPLCRKCARAAGVIHENCLCGTQ